MRIKRKTLGKVILVAMTLIILNLRPAMIGQVLNEGFLLVPMFGLGFLYLLLRLPVRITASKMVLLMITAGFVFYLVVQTWLTVPKDVITPIQIGVVMLSVAIATTVMFDRQDTLLVVKTIAMFFLILAVSQLLTYSYWLLGGPTSSIWLGTLFPRSEGLGHGVEWYFPFTLTVGSDRVGNIVLPRAGGIFREAGIYQMLIVFSFFAFDYLDVRYRGLARLLLIFSLFTTISTAGYVFFLVCVLYRMLSLRLSVKRVHVTSIWRILAGMISIGLLAITIYLVVWKAGAVSVMSKLYVQGYRLKEVSRTLELLPKDLIFGRGFMAFQEEKMGMHLIGVLPSIGLFGGFLYLLMIAFGILSNYTRDTFVLFLPILATLLFAQPVYQKGITLFLLFLSMKSIRTGNALRSVSELSRYRAYEQDSSGKAQQVPLPDPVN